MKDASQEKKVTNVVVLATHGSFFVPSELQARLKIDERLLKNFSDFGTQYLLPDCVPEEQRVVAWFSRALGDPNRVIESEDIFRETDFGGRMIWKESLTAEEREHCLEKYYTEYHQAVQKTIAQAEKENDRVLIVDIHDTGNMVLGEDKAEDTVREWTMPPLCLGDRDGQSCDPAITQFFAQALQSSLGMEVTLNTPYKGGYVTKKYGEEYNQELPEASRFNRNVIQLEVGRYLYMDEQTQMLIPEKCLWLREGLEKALLETSQYLSSGHKE